MDPGRRRSKLHEEVPTGSRPVEGSDADHCNADHSSAARRGYGNTASSSAGSGPTDRGFGGNLQAGSVMSNLSSVVDSIYSMVDWSVHPKNSPDGTWAGDGISPSVMGDLEKCESTFTAVSSLGFDPASPRNSSSHLFSRQSLPNVHESDFFAMGRTSAYEDDAPARRLADFEEQPTFQLPGPAVQAPAGAPAAPSVVAALGALAEMQSQGFDLQTIQNLLNYMREGAGSGDRCASPANLERVLHAVAADPRIVQQLFGPSAVGPLAPPPPPPPPPPQHGDYPVCLSARGDRPASPRSPDYLGFAASDAVLAMPGLAMRELEPAAATPRTARSYHQSGSRSARSLGPRSLSKTCDSNALSMNATSSGTGVFIPGMCAPQSQTSSKSSSPDDDRSPTFAAAERGAAAAAAQERPTAAARVPRLWQDAAHPSLDAQYAATSAFGDASGAHGASVSAPGEAASNWRDRVLSRDAHSFNDAAYHNPVAAVYTGGGSGRSQPLVYHGHSSSGAAPAHRAKLTRAKSARGEALSSPLPGPSREQAIEELAQKLAFTLKPAISSPAPMQTCWRSPRDVEHSRSALRTYHPDPVDEFDSLEEEKEWQQMSFDTEPCSPLDSMHTPRGLKVHPPPPPPPPPPPAADAFLHGDLTVRSAASYGDLDASFRGRRPPPLTILSHSDSGHSGPQLTSPRPHLTSPGAHQAAAAQPNPRMFSPRGATPSRGGKHDDGGRRHNPSWSAPLPQLSQVQHAARMSPSAMMRNPAPLTPPLSPAVHSAGNSSEFVKKTPRARGRAKTEDPVVTLAAKWWTQDANSVTLFLPLKHFSQANLMVQIQESMVVVLAMNPGSCSYKFRMTPEHPVRVQGSQATPQPGAGIHIVLQKRMAGVVWSHLSKD